jgi:hypothetical protein
VGTFTILRAPCGARVYACDGLAHRFGRAPHPGGKVVWSGGGSLGVSTMVKAPPRGQASGREAASAAAAADDDADVSRRHRHDGHHRRNGDDDDGAWHTAVRFSTDGVWGEGWALKDAAADAAPHPATPAFEAAARVALSGAGVAALPGDAGWQGRDGASPTSASPGPLRRAWAAVRATAARAGLAVGGFGGDDSTSVTCNGKRISGWLPCVGDLEIAEHPTGGHGRLDGSCHGVWAGAALHTCNGLSTTHLRPEKEEGDEDDGAGGGAVADPASACPAHWSLRRQCDGKSGAGMHPGGGVHVWCSGRTSGAVLTKGEGRGRHRRHRLSSEEGGEEDDTGGVETIKVE